ncbi:MAG: hypothetical protein A2V65_08305 [Deltaproteobacteria bacterium RBG_13_49_15]|nr:MAG: hypothetical protein A2V65_08305 [Deltaproteobacteria bacterium RBG_13_49_15]
MIPVSEIFDRSASLDHFRKTLKHVPPSPAWGFRFLKSYLILVLLGLQAADYPICAFSILLSIHLEANSLFLRKFQSFFLIGAVFFPLSFFF